MENNDDLQQDVCENDSGDNALPRHQSYDSYQTDSNAIMVYDDGISRQIIINQNVDDDEDLYDSDNIRSKEFEAKLNGFIYDFRTSLQHSITSPENKSAMHLTTGKPLGFQYKLNRRGQNNFESFMKLATNEFMRLNELRTKLCYFNFQLFEKIETPEYCKFDPELPLSKMNAWIWMCSEITAIYQSTMDILQDPEALVQCKELIRLELLSHLETMQRIKSALMGTIDRFKKFEKKFGKVHNLIRKNFQEAISAEAEKLQQRFLAEKHKRSTEESISVLSRSSPFPAEAEPVENVVGFVCWGIDGLSMKLSDSKEYILLKARKTNLTQFHSALRNFFDGLTCFLKRADYLARAVRSNVPRIEKREKSNDLNSLMQLLELSKPNYYVFPMEQTRGIQAAWLIQETIQESRQLAQNMVIQMETSLQLWRSVFGKEKAFQEDTKVRLEYFTDWKYYKDLTFQLTLMTKETPRKCGNLSLLVPNDRQNGTPIFFQVFENIFHAVIDFKEEYNERLKLLLTTGIVRDEDIYVCSDPIQNTCNRCNILVKRIKRISETIEVSNNKLHKTIQLDTKQEAFYLLNIWFFACAEALLSINSYNSKERERNTFIQEFKTCFHLFKDWLTLTNTAIRKYEYHLRRVQALKSSFEKIISIRSTKRWKEFLQTIKQQRHPTAASSRSNISAHQNINITFGYDALRIENSGVTWNLRLLVGHELVPIIALFLKQTKDLLSQAIAITSESVDLSRCVKFSERSISAECGFDKIKTADGIRTIIQQMENELRNAKKPRFNFFEALIGFASLQNLELEIRGLIAQLHQIRHNKVIMVHDLKFPKMVLKERIKRSWKKPNKLLYNSVADYVCGRIVLPISEKPLVGEIKHILGGVAEAHNNVAAEQEPSFRVMRIMYGKN